VGCGECVEICPQGALSITPRGIQTNEALCRGCGTCCRQCPALAREPTARYETVKNLLAIIKKDMVFYETSHGGVTFSGGEPLMQWQVLLSLLKGCCRRNIHTAVDTSGFAPWKVFQEIVPFTRLFLYDLKTMDDEIHKQFTGVSNEIILSNLERLTHRGAKVIIRIPLIPGVNDSKTDIDRAGRFIAGLRSHPPVELLPYHDFQISKYDRLGMSYRGRDIPVPSPEAVNKAVEQLKALGVTVTV